MILKQCEQMMILFLGLPDNCISYYQVSATSISSTTHKLFFLNTFPTPPQHKLFPAKSVASTLLIISIKPSRVSLLSQQSPVSNCPVKNVHWSKISLVR